MKVNINKIINLINSSDNIVLSTHEKPDADGLGSSIAFYYYLRSLNKNVKIIQPSIFPYECSVIDPDKIVETFEDNHIDFIKKSNLVILFDVGHYKRANPISSIAIDNSIDLITVDHHKNDDLSVFSSEIIDISAPATGLLVFNFLKKVGFDFSNNLKVSNAIYAAIMTDTGSFRYSNTTSECHHIAAELINNGVKPYDIYVPIYEQRNLSQIRLFSHLINNLKFDLNNSICYGILTSDSFKNTKSQISDIDGFTEFIRSIKNVEIAFLLTEQEDGTFRINFRSKGSFTVNDVASTFGGGGHQFAAGCKISNLTPVEIESKVLNLLKTKMG